MQIVKNGGLKENWLALFISIAKGKSSSKSLNAMGITISNENLSIVSQNQRSLKEHARKVLTKEKLKELYVEKGLTNAQISRKLNVAHTTLTRYLKQYNLY